MALSRPRRAMIGPPIDVIPPAEIVRAPAINDRRPRAIDRSPRAIDRTSCANDLRPRANDDRPRANDDRTTISACTSCAIDRDQARRRKSTEELTGKAAIWENRIRDVAGCLPSAVLARVLACSSSLRSSCARLRARAARGCPLQITSLRDAQEGKWLLQLRRVAACASMLAASAVHSARHVTLSRPRSSTEAIAKRVLACAFESSQRLDRARIVCLASSVCM